MHAIIRTICIWPKISVYSSYCTGLTTVINVVVIGIEMTFCCDDRIKFRVGLTAVL